MSKFPTPNFSIDLSDDVALVTGATSGLGWRFAEVLAACGARVAICGRREERLRELTKVIEDNGGECLPIVMDMTDRESIRNGVDSAEAAFGTVNILVNNAGIPDAAWAVKMDDSHFDRVMETNLEGPWILSTEVAKRLMKQEQSGRMVNIASVAAYNTNGDSAAALYATTKAAVVRMTEALACEWARFNINVNCIAPGAFKTEMLDGMFERMGDFSGTFPRKRALDPAQMDSTLLYLVSPASECVTGTSIIVDDGQSPR